MYNEAKQVALNNGHEFHIAAYTKGSHIIGTNSTRNSARYIRRFQDGTVSHDVHAEVDLILKLREKPERIWVVRFNDKGEPTMAMPCFSCKNFLRIKGIKIVYYTDWDGQWQRMDL